MSERGMETLWSAADYAAAREAQRPWNIIRMIGELLVWQDCPEQRAGLARHWWFAWGVTVTWRSP